jgi:hypothetical protein
MLALDRRSLGRFALRAALLLTLGMLPWPGLGRVFTSGVNAVANSVLHGVRLQSIYILELGPVEGGVPGQPPGTWPWHSALTVQNIDSGASTRAALNLRSLVYLPIWVAISLTLAAPIRRDRPWLRSVLWAALFVGAFVLFCTVLGALTFLTSERVQAVPLGNGGRAMVGATFGGLADLTLVIPALLWLLARWLGGALTAMQPAPDAPTPPRQPSTRARRRRRR